MDRLPRPPEAFFEGTPSPVRAYIEQLHAYIENLETRVAELEAKLGTNSTNSSKPPSAEHPHAKSARPQPPSPRPPGGQPGHPKHERALAPVEQCQAVLTCRPAACRRCGQLLTGTDPEPIR